MTNVHLIKLERGHHILYGNDAVVVILRPDESRKDFPLPVAAESRTSDGRWVHGLFLPLSIGSLWSRTESSLIERRYAYTPAEHTYEWPWEYIEAAHKGEPCGFVFYHSLASVDAVESAKELCARKLAA